MKLTTERLEIRPFQPTDISAAFAYLSDAQVMEFVEPPFDMAKTVDFIRENGMGNAPRVYALVEKGNGDLIGHVIFHPFESDSVYELGWILGRSSWGKGYALEISRALVRHGFTILRLRQIVVETVPENVKARKVIEKLGMCKQAACDGLDVWFLDHDQSQEVRI